MKTSTKTPERHSLSGPTMGTRYSAVFYAASTPATLPAALHQAVTQVDEQMSTWKADSALMRLNRAPCQVWLEVPEALFEVLLAALQVSELSAGAFEIGVGELVSACGFASQPAVARLPGKPPSARTVLELDVAQRRLRKHAPIQLDLNGIAKGFAVDQMARCLDAHGLDAYLVGLDGEMRSKGCKADGSPWCLALEKPIKNRREILGSLQLQDTSVATSGNYRHWRERQGRLISHTMDPHNGAPLDSPLASVSVLCGSCMYADAWATALLVLGPQYGQLLAREQGLAAIFVSPMGDGFVEQIVGL